MDKLRSACSAARILRSRSSAVERTSSAKTVNLISVGGELILPCSVRSVGRAHEKLFARSYTLHSSFPYLASSREKAAIVVSNLCGGRCQHLISTNRSTTCRTFASWLSLIVVWNVVIFPVNGDPDAMMLVVLPISSCIQLSTQIVSLFSLLANGRFVLRLGLWRHGRRTRWWHLAAEDGRNGNCGFPTLRNVNREI